jgi:hypothetical protein
VPVGRLQPGGLGIDHDLTHDVSRAFRYGSWARC